MSDLVTAIIPTYNYARFVVRAVTSVLEQSYSPIECIVVDDGSVDETQEVLQPLADRITIIRQANQGLSAARNRGLAEARGRYIAFLDADDWWLKDKVASQVRWFQEHPEVGCLGCGREHREFDGSTNTFPGQRNHASRTQTLRRIAVRSFWIGGSGSGAMVRRQVLEQTGGFDQSLTAGEDWDMWLRIAAVTDIDNVPDILTCISRHRTGVFRNVARMERNAWAVYDKAIRAWPDKLTAVDRRKIRALILADAAGESRVAGDRRAAMSYLTRSLAAWPFEYRRWLLAAGTIVR